MVAWKVPADLRAAIPALRPTIYCNKLLKAPLEKAMRNLVERGHAGELHTWDGCFIVRPIRGYAQTWSLHSWGLAVDLNAATNGLGKEPTLSEGFVRCFIDAGFDWGGTWKRKDGMHFQLSTL